MSGALDAVATPVQSGEDACCVPGGASAQDVVLDDRQVAALAKAIAHPVRVRILRLLEARQECITGDLVDELGFAQSTVSGHLRILREAGLVQGVVEGPRTRYCVNSDGLQALRRAVASL
jgi:ArsR family transcriptional regulator, arsenate/arsenite/antimonite-responsive transcriptional repressor